MSVAIERTTVGLELTFLDEDGSTLSVAAMTAFLWEAHSVKFGVSNPVLSGTTLPVANPHVIVIDLTTLDVDAVGDRLEIYFKLTYNSVKLGIGAITRDGPVTVYLKNSKIAT